MLCILWAVLKVYLRSVLEVPVRLGDINTFSEFS